MYLLELSQKSRNHVVGLFEKKEDAVDWIENLPNVKRVVDKGEGYRFINYTLTYEDLPLYEEIHWQNSIFPLTKFMFVPDEGVISCLIWEKLPVLNRVHGLVDGMTRVDAYSVTNEEAKQYIQTREAIRLALTSYYKKQGKRVHSAGLGSEDGEYLLLDDAFLIHLDAYTIEQWIASDSVDNFVHNYVEK